MGDYHIRESEWKEVKNDVKEILTNHLPHIRTDVAVTKYGLGITIGLILYLVKLGLS